MTQSIVQIFHVNAHWLLTGEGEMYQSKLENPTIESTLSVSAPVSHQEKFIKNHRKARIHAFIDYWFDEESPDDQAWLEVQLQRSIPEYKTFIFNKETVEKSQPSR